MASEADLRRLALSLPNVVEKSSYGTPGFRVSDRLFARLRPEDDSVVLWCDSPEEKAALLAAEPAKLFTTPHYDGSPTVLVRLDAVDDRELWELLADSWYTRASKRLRDAFDKARPTPP